MKSSLSISLALVLALGASAWAQDGDGARAQDGLTPTDILPMGRFTAGVGLQTVLGKTTLKAFNGALDEGGDVRSYDVVLAASAGLGFGIEVEAYLPISIVTETKIDTSSVEFIDTSKGMGDLQLAVNMRLAEESPASPHLMAGLLIGIPTGSDEPGEPEVTTSNPLLNSAGEDGGIGSGAVQLGLQLGLSKRIGNLEPYALVRYVWGNTSTHGAIQTDHADLVNFLAGLEIHAGDQITVDLRAVVDYHTKQVDKDRDAGTKETQEAHLQYGFEGRLYGSLGSHVALVLGVGFLAVEDHAVVKESDVNLEGTYLFSITIGIQIVLGR